MLIEPNHMGTRFKIFSMFPSSMKDILIKYPPAGFYRDLSGGGSEDDLIR